MRQLKILFFSFLIITGLQGCSKESLNEPVLNTTVSVKLNGTQSQYDEVWIEITDVLLKVIDNENAPNCWLSLKTSDNHIYNYIDITKTFNLDLVNEVNIPSGMIYEIKLVFGDNNRLIYNGKPINLNTNSVYQSSSGVRIDENLESNEQYIFNLEFETNNSILETPNENYYILQPILSLL
ncbi:MAG: DUF4382 domain-containing protein [Flavobacteriaceae bacterium]|nr:DUF4382 domain-containing protein [Bacteroidia bacterium]NNK82670.1 DUF4382 domain-containing protein [Flavobacteriaceae bacterium]